MTFYLTANKTCKDNSKIYLTPIQFLVFAFKFIIHCPQLYQLKLRKNITTPLVLIPALIHHKANGDKRVNYKNLFYHITLHKGIHSHLLTIKKNIFITTTSLFLGDLMEIQPQMDGHSHTKSECYVLQFLFNEHMKRSSWMKHPICLTVHIDHATNTHNKDNPCCAAKVAPYFPSLASILDGDVVCIIFGQP